MYYPDATFRVVVCGVSDDAVADLTTHLDEGVDIRIATGGEEIRSHLDECACLVLGGGCAGAIDAEFRETIRDHSPELPVIAILEDDPGTLRRISDATPVRYLPPDADPGVLADYVHDAIADYERRRERRHHSTILESMFRQFPYTMYVKDEQARHRMMTDIPGTPDPDEVLGKTDVEVYGNEPEVRTWYQDDLDVIESGSPVIEREERFEEGNVTVWTESTKVPWHDGGRVRGLVGITLDVTERKELEQELDRRHALHRRIARYIAHDLRNPLNLARGSLELARESPDAETLDRIETALDRIEEVATDMRHVVGEDQTRSVVEETPVRLVDAIEDAWTTVDPDEATLQAEIPEKAVILADRSPLQELFENLFRNAVEHGGRDVTVRVGLLPDGFFVADDGVGLSTDVKDLLQKGITAEKGSGLGLAIVTEIANTYDWTLAAADSADGGARFDFRGCHLVARPPEDVEVGEDRPLESSRDVGGARPPGTSQREDGTWIVEGGGTNVWQNTNEHHFVYAELRGDARVTARIASLERIEPYTKAGVMIRGGLAERDPFGYVGMTADHGSEVLWRTATDTETTSDQFDETVTLPHWYRVVRTGEDVTVKVSRDGAAWTPIDQRRVEISPPLYAGIVVCSHREDTLSEARFEDVTVQPLRTGE